MSQNKQKPKNNNNVKKKITHFTTNKEKLEKAKKELQKRSKHKVELNQNLITGKINPYNSLCLYKDKKTFQNHLTACVKEQGLEAELLYDADHVFNKETTDYLGLSRDWCASHLLNKRFHKRLTNKQKNIWPLHISYRLKGENNCSPFQQLIDHRAKEKIEAMLIVHAEEPELILNDGLSIEKTIISYQEGVLLDTRFFDQKSSSHSLDLPYYHALFVSPKIGREFEFFNHNLRINLLVEPKAIEKSSILLELGFIKKQEIEDFSHSLMRHMGDNPRYRREKEILYDSLENNRFQSRRAVKGLIAQKG